jgi:hypothetical protein
MSWPEITINETKVYNTLWIFQSRIFLLKVCNETIESVLHFIFYVFERTFAEEDCDREIALEY